MSKSVITYDCIRTKTIQSVGGSIRFDDINDGILSIHNNLMHSIPVSDNTVIIGTNPFVLSDTESISIAIDNHESNVKFSLNPVREEHLSPIKGPILDSHHSYSTFIVEGIGYAIANMYLTEWTSYFISTESISNIGNSFIRIHNDWMVRYTDVIDIKQVAGSTHVMGDKISPSISLIPDDNSITLSSSINSMWISKISIMRTRILPIT